MKKSGSSKQPKPVDPAELIRLQAQYNRVGQSGPFGSARYHEGPGGTEIQTELAPQMQGLVDNQFRRANTESTRYQLPPQFAGLQNSLLNRVSQRYAGPQAGPQGDSLAEARRVLKKTPTTAMPIDPGRGG